ncbi:MAG: enoyl-CoA hydratase-related protein [Chloroflexi bacterium]|nr:enoyl-CoA hydratase-related protein [Chloroflexota bacterium]MDA1217875.1 enoyl-CoA hydratase-related protein [Chloroflexota bacterium]
MQYKFLTYKSDGAVATLTLNRPDQCNLIDCYLAAEMRDACHKVRQDDNVRVLVLTGAGAAFSLGREPLPTELATGSAIQRQAWIEQLRVADALANLPIPVIVSINGDALDHGLELALAGDIRISAEPASFGLTDLSKPGCFPWDGGTQRLPRLVGPAWASDLMLTSLVIGSAEALSIGLVNRVVPPGELTRETQRLAEAIAAGGPIAARYAKEAITKGADLSLAEGLRLEADLNIILQSTDDRAEGLQSFVEKRPPRFTGQ